MRSSVRRGIFPPTFENLPPGIIICDTPGLDDAQLYNSESYPFIIEYDE